MSDLVNPIPRPPRPIEYAGAAGSGWWLSILSGAALVIVGVWLLTHVFESVKILGILVGLSLVIGGITEAIALGRKDEAGASAWLGGGLLVVTGLVVLAWPDITLQVVAVVAGLGLLVAGVTWALGAVWHRNEPDWPIRLGMGGAGIAFGLVVLAWPNATLVVLAVVLGIRAIATGLLAIGAGWQLRRLNA